MSSASPSVLEQLRRLDKSSPKFHDRLSNVLYGEKYQKCAPNLPGDDSASVVEYLNGVRRHIAPFSLPSQPT